MHKDMRSIYDIHVHLYVSISLLSELLSTLKNTEQNYVIFQHVFVEHKATPRSVKKNISIMKFVNVAISTVITRPGLTSSSIRAQV